uniref:Immunoglobulin domain-containing protein n=1 Tax=Sinocyclocheilus grahami TaxID=75366 RepID=A0A672KER7_SINGR
MYFCDKSNLYVYNIFQKQHSLLHIFAWLIFFSSGVSGVEADEVSVMEGDSVTLHTNVTTAQEEEIMWYFNKTQIAEITGDQSKICTDEQCKERFRDRLKVDHQTGSLTITNITITDSGEYDLQIRSSDNEKTFNVTVDGERANLSLYILIRVRSVQMISVERDSETD